MSFARINDPDLDERAEKRVPEQVLDPISLALDSGVFVRSHRFGTLFLTTRVGRSPRLSVSRYYWDLEPPVAIDFVREIKYGQEEVDCKRAYFSERAIRYVLAAGEWDEEAVSGGRPRPVERLTDPEPAETPVEAPESTRPLTAPRRARPART